jgi:hypothetical protein
VEQGYQSGEAAGRLQSLSRLLGRTQPRGTLGRDEAARAQTEKVSQQKKADLSRQPRALQPQSVNIL